jgi:hypothetical protein
LLSCQGSVELPTENEVLGKQTFVPRVVCFLVSRCRTRSVTESLAVLRCLTQPTRRRGWSVDHSAQPLVAWWCAVCVLSGFDYTTGVRKRKLTSVKLFLVHQSRLLRQGHFPGEQLWVQPDTLKKAKGSPFKTSCKYQPFQA